MIPHCLSTGCIFALALLMALSCTGPARTAGTSTQTENVAGVVYNSDGTRAAGALVRFVPVDYDPAAQKQAAGLTDSIIADDTGHYEIAPLKPTTYNLFFSGNGDLAFRDSMTVAPDSQPAYFSDTLRKPGSISGTVRLQPGDDPRKVAIGFIGTLIRITPDSTGKFEATNMAKGRYTMRISTESGAYLPKDTALAIGAGKADTLARDLVVPYIGLPAPEGLGYAFDTLNRTIILFWNMPATTHPTGAYAIYRKQESDTGFISLKRTVANSPDSDHISAAQGGQILEYKIAAIDTAGVEGLRSPAVLVNTSIVKILRPCATRLCKR
jgi:hypothetical protein